jgi:hypothetical protein
MLDSVPFAAAVLDGPQGSTQSLAHDIPATAGDHSGGGRDQGEEHCDENTGRCHHGHCSGANFAIDIPDPMQQFKKKKCRLGLRRSLVAIACQVIYEMFQVDLHDNCFVGEGMAPNNIDY